MLINFEFEVPHKKIVDIRRNLDVLLYIISMTVMEFILKMKK